MDFLKENYAARRRLYKNRDKFWHENKKNCERNCLFLVNLLKKQYQIPQKWKINIIVGNFSEKNNAKIKPFDYFSYSLTNLVVASKKQNYEFLIFLNKARIGFLSKAALIPLIAHEMQHIKQGALNPKEYLLSTIDDKLSEKLEREAELSARNIKNWDEFRKQQVLESVLYCYDLFGWNGARKMALFFYKEIKEIYGDGYLGDINEEEFKIFLNAMKKKDINLFIDYFQKFSSLTMSLPDLND
ncbi:hypothetical protein J4466_02245 [Candidatus Pacearchaeota archaeon]|nr:hypothetical protein [Candidatus Pacearchaeota archaeon]